MNNELFTTIVQALHKAGITEQGITLKHLAAIDEFHVRGHEISREQASAAGLQPGLRVLDVGCGLGGACRLLAAEFGCQVTGIDITETYIRTAIQLTAFMGMQQSTRFVHGSALALPFGNDSFDIVWTQHVQMNIADKELFYAEIHRVLTTNGRFIYYDILSDNHLPVQLPVPWAADASLNHLITSQELHALLQKTGFISMQVTDETEKGIAFLNNLLRRIAQKGWPAVGTHMLMGDNALEKLTNLYNNLVEGRIRLESGIYGR
jgi:ubiquinone/menaquinone biosynthesis C-methylase UbiE